MSKFYLEIAVFNSLNKFFHYAPLKNSESQYNIGARVWVPFGRTPKVLGIITKIVTTPAEYTLKPILELIDSNSILNPKLIKLAFWIINYYFAPPGEVFSLFLPLSLREGKTLESLNLENTLYLNIKEDCIANLKITVQQRKLLNTLISYPNGLKESFLLNLNFKQVTINALVSEGLIFRKSKEDIDITNPNTFDYKTFNTSKTKLNTLQSAIVEEISKNLEIFKVFLLNGVTGSGKTEVYIESIIKVLNNSNNINPQILVLSPEIGLTPQLIKRFKDVFNLPLIVLHSRCTKLERARGWYQIQSGEPCLVLGTRSAVFAPFTNLKLIIIDEEHDSSYRQHDSKVRYSARDIAVFRANEEKIQIILGSATPASESLYNCQSGKYTELLMNERAFGNLLPKINVIDIKGQKLKSGLSYQSIELIKDTLKLNQKVLIFLNKRGYAPLMLCHSCGWIASCKNCTAHLSVHLFLKKLICHHCDYSIKIPINCGNCNGAEVNSHGVGTEQLEDYFKKNIKLFNLCPENIIRLDKDTTSKKGSLERILKNTNSNQAQVIIGTQMLAKGHNFSNLNLVIILEGDYAFFSSDFRAQEKMLQLTLQVSGRAGRDSNEGKVCIQTHFPEHKIWPFIREHSYSDYMKEILDLRSETNLPPYSHIALLRAEATKLDLMLEFLNEAKSCGIAIISSKALQSFINFQGPIPAPLIRKNNVYRGQLMVVCKDRVVLHKFLKVWEINFIKLKQSQVKYLLEIDPVELF